MAGTFGSHLAECWSFCFLYFSDLNHYEKSFFGIPDLKDHNGVFTGRDLLSRAGDKTMKNLPFN